MNNSFLHRIPSAAALALAVLALQWANAEPPRFLAPMPGKEEEKTTTDILPIPSEATEEQKEEYEKVIEKARTDDVSVTDQAALMYRGLACLVDEEYEESIPFFEEALRRDPSLQAAWEGLGWAHIRIDDKKTAKAIWDYFRRLMPEQPLPYALLGQMAVLEYDWPLADRHFKKSLELKPDQFDVRYWYAQNLMRLGKASEAEDIFRALIKLEPDRLDIEIDLAGLLVQRLEYNEAVEIYRRVNDEIPDNPRFLLEEALLELKVGEVTRADELCQQVLELEPSNLDAMRLRADIAEIIGLNDISPLRDLIDQTDDPLQRAALRIRLANRCLLENRNKPGQYESSMILDLIHDAIKDNPASVEYRILYAQLLVMDNQYAKARAVANAVLERFNRANFDAKQVLLEVDMRESKYDDALQVLSDLYSGLSADDPMAHYYRARIYTLQGRYADAKREIDFIEPGSGPLASLHRPHGERLDARHIGPPPPRAHTRPPAGGVDTRSADGNREAAPPTGRRAALRRHGEGVDTADGKARRLFPLVLHRQEEISTGGFLISDRQAQEILHGVLRRRPPLLPPPRQRGCRRLRRTLRHFRAYRPI